MKSIAIISFLLVLGINGFGQETMEYYQNGSLRSYGVLKDNKKEGLWVELKENGDSLSACNYKGGILNGPFWRYTTGTNYKSTSQTSQLNNYSDWQTEKMLIIGKFKNGKLNGIVYSYYNNGILNEKLTYKFGVLNGKSETYHDNGNKRLVENYENGELDGVWEQYYNTGLLREKRVYKNNVLIEKKKMEWYDNKKMKNKTSFIYVDEEKLNNGEWATYYENGNIQSQSIYINGKTDGVWLGYYENGELKYKMVYENGIYQSYTEFNEDGSSKIKK